VRATKTIGWPSDDAAGVLEKLQLLLYPQVRGMLKAWLGVIASLFYCK
jgi:hypothetical protein